MRTFAYKGFDAAGRATRGLIEAHEPKDAREKLIKQGVFAEDVRDSVEAQAASQRGRGLKLAARAAMYRQLAVLLKSGLPLAAALEVLIQSPDADANPALLAAVRDRLRGGASFADALSGTAGRTIPPEGGTTNPEARSSFVVPPSGGPSLSAFEHAIVQAGEHTGNLDAVLDQLAGYLDEQQTLSDGLRSAMLYPMLVICLAIFVAIGMLGFVVPSLSKMFTESRIELPALTRGVVWVSRYIWIFAAAIAAAVWLAWGEIRRRWHAQASREKMEQRFFTAPWLGRGVRLMCGVRFARTMSLLLRGGVPLVDGLALAGRATGSAWITRLTAEESESVRHGRSFSQSLRRVPPLSGLLASWIQAGEASGSLDTLLHTAAERMQQQWTKFLNNALNLIGPLLILMVGAFVLLIALAILLPILSLSQGIH